MVVGQRVLDGACGTGYGTSVLRRAGAISVHGVDLSKDDIDEATRLYSGPGLSFDEGNLLDLDVPAESYDLVVSFESIEHVNDDARYVAEMRRVLRRGGTFLCSTPNRTVTNPGTMLDQKPYNPFHAREYSINDLATRLKAEFDAVAILGQQTWSLRYCRALSQVARVASPMTAVRIHQLNKLLHSASDKMEHFAPRAIGEETQPETIIAVCS